MLIFGGRMTHTITPFLQPTDMIIMLMSALVFCLCFGFTLWKALCNAKSAIYWQTILCIFLIGMATICFSAMENYTADDFFVTGSILLSIAALLTVGGVLRNTIRFYINNRLQEKLVLRYR